MTNHGEDERQHGSMKIERALRQFPGPKNKDREQQERTARKDRRKEQRARIGDGKIHRHCTIRDSTQRRSQDKHTLPTQTQNLFTPRSEVA